ncbi:MAG: hypothetical protein HYT22_00265 [Candidatus Niyogibacteria bacterium]|nr:hypothetical protein [Candidatus Niyogibacteria bacterium]
MKLRRILTAFVGLAAPLFVFSADISTIIGNVEDLINRAVGVLIAIAGLVFLWGVFKFVSAAGDEKARTTGRQFIIWGLIGLTVMFAFWGLVNVLITFLIGGPAQPGGGLTVPKVTR